MSEASEKLMRSYCCACLSSNRKLDQLFKIVDGLNNLFTLLSFDTEAYREGFYMDSTNLFVCWECKYLLKKFKKFRDQVCIAQKKLPIIIERHEKDSSITLSNLCISTQTTYNSILISSEDDGSLLKESDNFIDCGPEADVKSEPEDIDDIPLALLNDNFSDDETNFDAHNSAAKNKIIGEPIQNKKRLKKHTVQNKKPRNSQEDEKCFSLVEMNEEEMLESRVQRKLTANYTDACHKCETCIHSFGTREDLNSHNEDLHKEKDAHTKCDICAVYIQTDQLSEHRIGHYKKLCCQFCSYISFGEEDIIEHLKTKHKVSSTRKKGQRKTPIVKRPGSKPRMNQAMTDKRTPYGYLCTECDEYFDNKNQRWKHIQRRHREGFKCETCGKKFAFRNNLTRHQQLHKDPLPREECTVCKKMIRVDLIKTHARIHTDRQTYRCEECQKSFVSLASYEHHLKYTQAHAAVDILKYKCSACEKGYRSKGELRDHFNYQHMATTLHKCPICEKALATRRCVTRHVRRAHRGQRESKRDKICQQCGRTFRDKKGLLEHELIHSGERPLSCEKCGAAFRQRASLYTHKKRVHREIQIKPVISVIR